MVDYKQHLMPKAFEDKTFKDENALEFCVLLKKSHVMLVAGE